MAGVCGVALVAVFLVSPFDGTSANLFMTAESGGAASRVTEPRNTEPDVAQRDAGVRDTLESLPTLSEQTWSRPSPRGAVLRSVVYPGWGQLANGRPYKACAVFAVEAYFIGVAILSSRRAQDLLDSSRFVTSESELAELERSHAHYIERRNARLWWLGAAILYSMLDAYVDANLSEVEEVLSKPPPYFMGSYAGEGGALWLGFGARF